MGLGNTRDVLEPDVQWFISHSLRVFIDVGVKCRKSKNCILVFSTRLQDVNLPINYIYFIRTMHRTIIRNV